MLRARAVIVAAVIVAGAGLSLSPVPAFAQAPDAYFEFLMARRLESEGNDPAALAALERAAAASPESAEVKAEIAAFHYRRNQRAEAEKAARAALALDDKSVEANRVLGLILTAVVESAGDRPSLQTAATLKDAIMHLERSLAGAPAADIQVQYTLGQLYIRSGDSDKAVQMLTRVLGQNPNSVPGRLMLARAYAAGNDLPGAISVARRDRRGRAARRGGARAVSGAGRPAGRRRPVVHDRARAAADQRRPQVAADHRAAHRQGIWPCGRLRRRRAQAASAGRPLSAAAGAGAVRQRRPQRGDCRARGDPALGAGRQRDPVRAGRSLPGRGPVVGRRARAAPGHCQRAGQRQRAEHARLPAGGPRRQAGRGDHAGPPGAREGAGQRRVSRHASAGRCFERAS